MISEAFYTTHACFRIRDFISSNNKAKLLWNTCLGAEFFLSEQLSSILNIVYRFKRSPHA